MEEINSQNNPQDIRPTRPQDNEQGRTIIIRKEAPKSNGMGTAGFVMSLLTIFFGWIPVLGWIMWLLGMAFSFAGLFKAPRGLAITGFIISIFGLLLLLVVFAWIAGFATFSM